MLICTLLVVAGWLFKNSFAALRGRGCRVDFVFMLYVEHTERSFICTLLVVSIFHMYIHMLAQWV